MYEALTVFAGELASREIEDHWGTCGLDDFIDAFYDSIKDTRIDYFETLERYGVEMSDRGLEACDVEHANAELVRALIFDPCETGPFRRGPSGRICPQRVSRPMLVPLEGTGRGPGARCYTIARWPRE